MFDNDDIWISKYKISEIYGISSQNLDKHIVNIYEHNELDKDSTCKLLLQVQQEGSRSVKRNIEHYNLDMIISLGYRVRSDCNGKNLFFG